MSQAPRTAAATAAAQRWHAERSATDPAKLGRAVRVVRAALEAHRLSLSDLLSGATAGSVELRSAPGERAEGR
ncbi:hypothetical protein N4G69_20215 [Streptomyces mirabilis]|uniref:hypothetical protein n=1 Tax=Streptomyces mirabilis TaxID=68239 RepID=UPI0021BE5E3E|nr:hypothetical protein [Streptomyces mirabilis]MCT9107931.1 hypothetical protein [Streptomyces mirabilis]